jgi:hypothetical protein
VTEFVNTGIILRYVTIPGILLFVAVDPSKKIKLSLLTGRGGL